MGGKIIFLFYLLLQFAVGVGLLQRKLNTDGKPDAVDSQLDLPALEDSAGEAAMQVRLGKGNYWQTLNANTYSLRKSHKTPWAKMKWVKLPGNPHGAAQKHHDSKPKSTEQHFANPKPHAKHKAKPAKPAKPVASPEKRPHFKPIKNKIAAKHSADPSAAGLSAAAGDFAKAFSSGQEKSHGKPDKRTNWEKLQDEWIVPEKPAAKPLISSVPHDNSKHRKNSSQSLSASSRQSRFAFPAPPPPKKVSHKKRQPQKAPKKEVKRLPTGEKVELCHVGNLHVILNSDLNIRQLTFGDNKMEPLIQTSVHCEGKPSSNCFKKHQGNACDLSVDHCPCNFDMPQLPLLDFEYRYIANRILPPADGQKKNSSNEVNSSHVALVGLGGGMLPQYLLEHNEGLVVDAIELNADVINVARSFFGVAKYESLGQLHIRHADGISALNAEQPGKYSTTVVDCFGDGRLPAGCRSNDFVKAVYRSLAPGGEVLQNVLISRPDNNTLDEDVRNDFEGLMGEYHAIFGPHAVALEAEVKGASNAVVRARKRSSVSTKATMT